MPTLKAKLGYLENLGITSIRMTPILRNRAVQPDGFGHHGYWVVDFSETLITFDTAASYRAVLMPEKLSGAKQSKVVASNDTRQTLSNNFEL